MNRYCRRPYRRYQKRCKPFEYTRPGKALAFGGKIAYKGLRTGCRGAKSCYKAEKGEEKMDRLAKGV